VMVCKDLVDPSLGPVEFQLDKTSRIVLSKTRLPTPAYLSAEMV
jgi:hypothetical protein